jgi:hypothetical protein
MSVVGSVASAVWHSPWAMSAIKSSAISYVTWNYGPPILIYTGMCFGKYVIYG